MPDQIQMSPPPPPPPPPSDGATGTGTGPSAVLFAVVRDLADLGARVAALERTGSDLAQRTEHQVQQLQQQTDIRLNALAGQIAHLDERLDQQDQMAASSQQQLRSQLGTLQQQQTALLAAEAERAHLLTEADETRARIARETDAAAQQRHKDTVSRLRRVLAGVGLFVASSTWPLLAGLPVRTRLLVLAAGVGVAVLWALFEYVRSLRRPHS